MLVELPGLVGDAVRGPAGSETASTPSMIDPADLLAAIPQSANQTRRHPVTQSTRPHDEVTQCHDQ
jgi:hypothetical protein